MSWRRSAAPGIGSAGNTWSHWLPQFSDPTPSVVVHSLVAFRQVLPHHGWHGRKGVVLAETARDPRGDWLLSRPSRAGVTSPRPYAGKPAESNQLTDLASSGWSTGRSLGRG
jgi:hypothetical protein